MRSIFKLSLLFAGLLLLVTPALATERPAILIVGDSLSAGFGMDLEQSWPRLLQNRLDDNGHRYRVVNSSITGDTTQGGLARLPRLLSKYRPEVVVIELGGNDGLRGIGIPVTTGNLSGMIERSLGIGAEVILAGIRLPPNYGATYTERFYEMYESLSRQYGISLVPFLLEGVVLDPELMLDDGIHPNASAQPRLLDNIWPYLKAALD
jgi:acyl-CoA thioesterase-1